MAGLRSDLPNTVMRVTQPVQVKSTLVNEAGFHDVSLQFQQDWAARLYGMRARAFNAWKPGYAQSGASWYDGSVPRSSTLLPYPPIRYAVRPTIYPVSVRTSLIGRAPNAVERGLALQTALQSMMAAIYDNGTNRG